MKKLLLSSLLSVVSFSALACPNLIGTYSQCFSDNGMLEVPQKVTILQINIGGVEVYNITSNYSQEPVPEVEELYADGKISLKVVDKQIHVTQSSCTENQLNVTEVTRPLGNEYESSEYVTKSTRAGNKLTIQMIANEGDNSMSDTVTCIAE